MSTILARPRDRRQRMTHIRVKPDVRRQLEDYVNQQETSLQRAILAALHVMGVPVDREDLVPVRKRRLRPRETDAEAVGISVYLPVYVRENAEAWLKTRPDMRLLNLILAGLRELGLSIEDEDLVIKKTWTAPGQMN